MCVSKCVLTQQWSALHRWMTQPMRATVLGPPCQPSPKYWKYLKYCKYCKYWNGSTDAGWEQLCWIHRANRLQNIGTSSYVSTKLYHFSSLTIVLWEDERTRKQTIFVRSDDDARLNDFNASKTGGESIRLKQYGSSWVTINVLVQT